MELVFVGVYGLDLNLLINFKDLNVLLDIIHL
jgi:hypothetical protein